MTNRYENQDTDLHVYPKTCGKKHILERNCWCKPSLEKEEDGIIIVVHNDIAQG